MARYLALIEYDATAAAFGLVIPDFPGCNAMGATFDEVEANGIEALRTILNFFLQREIADEAARRRGLTRSGFLASAARDKIAGDRGLTAAAT